MEQAYIIGACRTAVGTFGGRLNGISAVKMGEIVIKEALRRANISPELVDEVIFGNVLQAGLGQNPARQAAIGAGIPVETPAMTVNKVCGSGLVTVNLAACAIKTGDAGCVVAGGMESMSNAPYLIKGHRWGSRMGNNEIIDEMIFDGLWEVFNNYHMGVTAENIAEKYGITREEQDKFALLSQAKAASARSEGRFKDEIVPLYIPQKNGEALIFEEDEYIRPDTNLEKLAKLKPAFKKEGTVTAGNASGINDGAAAVIVAGSRFIKEHNIKPLASIVSYASKGVPPEIMGVGPVPTVKAALQKAGLSINDVGLMEVNEAFASQALAVSRELKLDQQKVNVNGGAIALGHPIGASGARILVTLLYEMIKRKETYGLATLCIGGGMGEATIIKRCE